MKENTVDWADILPRRQGGAYCIRSAYASLRVLSVYGSEDGVMNREAYEKNRANLPAVAETEGETIFASG